VITQRRRCISCGDVGCIYAALYGNMLHCIKYNVGIVFVSSWTLIGDGYAEWCRHIKIKVVLALDTVQG